MNELIREQIQKTRNALIARIKKQEIRAEEVERSLSVNLSESIREDNRIKEVHESTSSNDGLINKSILLFESECRKDEDDAKHKLINPNIKACDDWLAQTPIPTNPIGSNLLEKLSSSNELRKKLAETLQLRVTSYELSVTGLRNSITTIEDWHNSHFRENQ